MPDPSSTASARVVRALTFAAALSPPMSAGAFCGFYVGKADGSLFNEASQVIIARDGPRTVISMLNDYRGDLSEFALVVPVPQVLGRDQINVAERRIFDRIDAYSAPRLVEYHDPDPCARAERLRMPQAAPSASKAAEASDSAQRALGVTVEARYAVGEYDISILSARESDGLERWLLGNGYRIPPGAAAALAPYVKQEMKFFVAKVNLKEHARRAGDSGAKMLRPLQFAFESPKFMLPMRLGMINAAGPQDLIIYVLSRRGRVESTNYQTRKLPANVDLPLFVRGEFARFYRSMFERQARHDDYRSVFTEYFWDMSWCDPCAADPLNARELRQAGVFWLGDETHPYPGVPGSTLSPVPSVPPISPISPISPESPTRRLPRVAPLGGAQPVMLTRLHLRYTADSFPEDLMLQETGDRQNFQTRYVLRHPFPVAPGACEAARAYEQQLDRRRQRDAEALAELTGWQLGEIRQRMDLRAPSRPWWGSLWNG